MLEAYRAHVAERAAQGIPPKPLTAQQVAELVELLKNPPAGEGELLVDLIANRVPPGVDEAAYVKAGFLSAVAKGETTCGLISRSDATRMLGQMLGGYDFGFLGHGWTPRVEWDYLGPMARPSAAATRRPSIERRGSGGIAGNTDGGDGSRRLATGCGTSARRKISG